MPLYLEWVNPFPSPHTPSNNPVSILWNCFASLPVPLFCSIFGYLLLPLYASLAYRCNLVVSFGFAFLFCKTLFGLWTFCMKKILLLIINLQLMMSWNVNNVCLHSFVPKFFPFEYVVSLSHITQSFLAGLHILTLQLWKGFSILFYVSLLKDQERSLIKLCIEFKKVLICVNCDSLGRSRDSCN